MMLKRLDMFSASLPRKCLYCRWGYPVVFGTTEWLDAFMCGKSFIDDLRSKRASLRLTEHGPGSSGRPPYAAITGPWDSCDGFQPVAFRPSRPGEFVNTRKLELLDRSGMFDEMEGRYGQS